MESGEVDIGGEHTDGWTRVEPAVNDGSMENAETITIRGESIELCQLLKFAGMAATGGEAKMAIVSEMVFVNGEIETRKRRKIVAGDRVTFGEQAIVVAA